MEQHAEIMPQARHVFVYGTLRRGGSNDINRLQPAPQPVGMAQVQGTLYTLGAYPGLRLGGDAPQAVLGEVYAITPALEAVLDRIEGIEEGEHSEYFKREVLVQVQGRSLTCLVYEINAARVQGRAPVAHGDWMRCAQL
ncbi:MULTISPECIES: gamma-glutamylcyclotransferase family protein [Ramlibacter]|uniref:Gamma-glutamylcyclotransferase n=1 Tax=Ramlibacter aquaticus TaxID=2780094 RepID=A0ABR9SC87_9BURK|nr:MULTISPECIES: gamma-glutamylcyclotransferase family protein [Ramlibacter]MBE7939948.1 gamma-glutamylcyclotransferase [Ramlibacter aquaticus]